MLLDAARLRQRQRVSERIYAHQRTADVEVKVMRYALSTDGLARIRAFRDARYAARFRHRRHARADRRPAVGRAGSQRGAAGAGDARRSAQPSRSSPDARWRTRGRCSALRRAISSAITAPRACPGWKRPRRNAHACVAPGSTSSRRATSPGAIIDGIVLEDKTYSLSFHFRHCSRPPRRAASARRRARPDCSRYPHSRRQVGAQPAAARRAAQGRGADGAAGAVALRARALRR